MTLVFNAGVSYANSELIDYQLVSHNVYLDKFRSGNHDADGNGEYDIRVDFFALINSESERKKEFKDREKMHFAGEMFGEIKIPNLSYWKPDTDEKEAMKVRITGDSIRAKLSQAMQQLQKKENELIFAVRLTLVEKNVKYWFFGDDKDLMSTMYYPIPPTKYDTPLRVNQNLTMKDDNGTLVVLKVVYDNPVTENRKSMSSTK